MRVATAYFKPDKNKTKLTPDFYAHRTNEWLVFPHEMDGLSRQEIAENKPHLLPVMDALEPTIKPVKLRETD